MRRLRKALGVILLLALTLGLAPAGAGGQKGPTPLSITRAGDEMRVRYSFEPARIQDAEAAGYQVATISGLSVWAPPGEPLVPVRGMAVLIPAGQKPVGVEVVAGGKVALGRARLLPASEPLPLDSQGAGSGPVPKAEVYAQKTPYPGRLLSGYSVQWKSGVPIVMGQLYPLQYVPATGETYSYESLTVVIKTASRSPDDDSAWCSPSETDLRVIQSLVDNPEEAQGYGLPAAPEGPSPLLGGGCKHVIITSRALAPAFAPLAAWRQAHGLTSAVVAVEDICAAYPGRDNAERVRNFIRDARKNNGVEFVLLGGDADGKNLGGESGNVVVPVRGLWAAEEDATPPNIPGDLYYACLDGSYDSNNNNIFGEPTDGEQGGAPDLLAEVYVGRAPVDSAWEAANFVNKTIAYEGGPSDDPYYAEAWMVGEKLWDDDPCAAELAVRAAQDAEPQGLLGIIRGFRDRLLAPQYVALYYRHSPTVGRVMMGKPSLMTAAACLLVKHAPALKDAAGGGDGGKVLTESDVAELVAFVHDLRQEVERQQGEGGAAEPGELLKELDKLEAFMGTLGGRTLGAALKASPYSAAGAPSAAPLSGETWGGDYKDEIKDGSSSNGYTTVGFPSSFKVQTLYDRDDPNHSWPKEDLLAVLSSGAHVVNHLGHANQEYVMKLSTSDVDGLTNSKYFLVYSQGCYAGAFDNRDYNGRYLSTDCIAEHLVTRPAGAFACVVNSRYGWGMKHSTDGPSQHFDRWFWDAVFDKGLTRLGAANQFSKEMNAKEVADDWSMRYCYYELNLLGDPATRLVEPSVPRGVAVTSLEVADFVRPGEEVPVRSRIANLGKKPEKKLQVAFSINGKKLKTVTVPEIPGGEAVDVAVPWKPGSAGKYEVQVAVAALGGGDDLSDNARSKTVWAVQALTVDDNRVECPDALFSDIRQAILSAGPGDTIKVYPGTYAPFKVDRKLNIVGLGYPVIDGRGGGDVIEIAADGTGLHRLVVQNSGSSKAGILVQSSNNAITGCVVSRNYSGLALNASSNNIVACNYMKDNDCGLFVQSDSRNNDVKANSIERNARGVYVYKSGSASDAGPNCFHKNNIVANTTNVTDETRGEACQWYDPSELVGNYWGSSPFGPDPYPLSRRYVGTGTIKGRMTVQGASPRKPVEVCVRGSEFVANVAGPGGSFELADVPLGPCTLIFTSPGCTDAWLPATVAAGSNDVGTVDLKGPVKKLWTEVEGKAVSAPVEIEAGGEVKLAVMAEYSTPKGARGPLPGAQLAWSLQGPISFDPETGTVRGDAAGSGQLKGTLQGKQVAVKVLVSPKLKSLAFAGDLKRMDVTAGKTTSLPTVEGIYEDGSRKDLTKQVRWEVGDSTIAKAESGKLKGLKKGRTFLRAWFAGLCTTKLLTVVTPPVKKLVVDPSSVTVEVGQTASLKAIAEFSDGTSEDVTLAATWKPGNAKVAKVSVGVVEGVAAGSTTAKATYQGKSVTAKVKVVL